MKNEYALRHFPVAAFAMSGAVHSGSEKLAAWARVMEETSGVGAETAVDFTLLGEMRRDGAGVDEPWLHLKVRAVLPLQCQRCLGPVDVPLEFERDFRFVATEALAAVEDEESEEDVLVLSPAFDMLELIEDELLMSMPPVPMHAACPRPVKMQAADADFVDVLADKSHPFAALEQFRKSRKE